MSVSGIAAYVEYGMQSAFGTPLSAGASTRAFGLDQKLTGLSINNNKMELGDLNSALVQKFAFGNFTGEFSVEWVLSNPWWIDTILAAASTTGVGPYTHTYDDSKTVRALTAEVGIDTTTDRVLQLKKSVARDINISTAINELVNVRGNFAIGATDDTAGTSLDASIQTDDIAFPYTMVHATLENPSGTVLAEVQNMELTLNPNIRYVYGPNNRDPQNAYKGRLEISGTFSLSVVDNTWWNAVMARAEPSNNTLRFKFSNGEAGTAERTMQFTLTGLGLGELNMPVEQYELVTEEIPFSARDIQVIAVNNTATPP